MNPYITIIVTSIAALAVAWMTRQLKISEFRQVWINGIREDISLFISKSHEWIDIYIKFNEENDQDIKSDMAKILDRIKYDALHVFRRIEMRFKNDDEKANELISQLNFLLSPAKLEPNNQYSSWNKMADLSVKNARNLLKEEWEVTKNPFRWILKNKFMTKKNNIDKNNFFSYFLCSRKGRGPYPNSPASPFYSTQDNVSGCNICAERVMT